MTCRQTGLGTPSHLYEGGQLVLSDHLKQCAPSPLRGGSCNLVRSHTISSQTGGAVCGCTEKSWCVSPGSVPLRQHVHASVFIYMTLSVFLYFPMW